MAGLSLGLFAALGLPAAAPAAAANGILACAAKASVTTAQEQPRPDAWWQQKASELLAASTKQHGNVLIIGDSIAAKWPVALPWPEDKAASVFRYAIGGDTTENILWRLARLPIEQMAPSQVVLIAGTNNLSTATDGCPIFAGIMKIVSEIRRRAPQAHLTVVAILPRGPDFSYKPDVIAEINAGLEALRTEQGFDVVDAKDKLIAASGGHNPSPLYEDLVHLSPAGYALLAEAATEQRLASKSH